MQKLIFLKLKALLIISVLLLTSCATNNSQLVANEIRSELYYGNTEDYFQKGLMGKVVIFADDDINENMILTLSDNTRRPTKKKDFKLGQLKKGNAFNLTLLPGNYFLSAEIEETIFTKRVYLTSWVTIARGDMQFVRLQKDKLSTEIASNVKYKEVKSGTIYWLIDLKNLLEAQIKITNIINKDRVSEFSVVVSNNVNEPQFQLNYKNITPVETINNTINKATLVFNPE
jgi:hypothetical protein